MKKLLLTFLSCMIIMHAHTQILPNLMATSIYEYDGTSFIARDSSRYFYSSGRTGQVEGTIKCDSSFMWRYNTNTDEFEYTSQQLQSFDGSNNLLIFINKLRVGSNWMNNIRTTRSYDVANHEIQSIGETWNGSSWDSNSKLVQVYDGNNITNRYTYNYNKSSKSWVSDYRDSIAYNVMGNYVFYRSQQWNVATSDWDNLQLIENVYDASNKNALTESGQVWDKTASIWVPSYKHTYTYDANGNNTSKMREEIINSIWDTTTNNRYGYDNNNNQLFDTTQQWNKSQHRFINLTRTETTYNSNNQQTSYSLKVWDENNNLWYHTVTCKKGTFYYEIPTVINNPKNLSNTLRLYPVPAVNLLSISVSLQNAGNLQFFITGMDGKIYQKWNTNATKEYKGTISLEGLPSGNYILTVTNGKEQFTKLFNILQ